LKVYRARAWRTGPEHFDPLDSSASVSGPSGWRFNDLTTEILYTAEVEALAILEVAIRPGLDSIKQILVATIELPDGLIVDPHEVGIVLPSNWNARPVAEDSRTIAGEFLDHVSRLPATALRPLGLRVPSVLSGTNYNVLLDPSRKGEMKATLSSRIPFQSLRTTAS
jgi:RES domain-containing protein